MFLMSIKGEEKRYRKYTQQAMHALRVLGSSPQPKNQKSTHSLNSSTMKFFFIHLSFLLIFLLVSFSGKSEIINVPAEVATIQIGINTADDGDTVLVAPGTYFENLVIDNKTIVLASHYILSGGDTTIISQTIIDGSDLGNVIQFRNVNKSTLIGFTITNGHTDVGNPGGNIYCFKSSPLIKNNIIKNGYAIGNAYWWYQKFGGGIFVENSSPIIIGNWIIENEAWDGGGGIFITNFSSPKIISNIIANNEAIGGAGISVGGQSHVLIKQNVIDNNRCQRFNGGGILMTYSFGIIENNTIVNNTAIEDFFPLENGEGSGIYLTNSIESGIIIRNNIIFNNEADIIGGVSCDTNSQIIFQHNNVSQNVGGNGSNYGNDCNPDVNSFSLDPDFVNFTSGIYTLNPNSPCVDTGLPDAIFNDPEDPNNLGMALFPAQGSLINDMGAFGGGFYMLDFDRDGLTDNQEINSNPATNPILADTDGDGALDSEELEIHETNPTIADSDNDGFNDGFEIEMYTDPKDETSFPILEKQMNYEILAQEARQLALQPFDSLVFYAVNELDPPIIPGVNSIGMVFQEALSIKTSNNFLDTLETYCFGRPRAGLDRTKVRIYVDKDNNGNYDLKSYSNAAPNYPPDLICPPIDTALLLAVGKFLAKLIIGHCRPDTASCPHLFDFGGAGYVRFSEYGGVFGASYRNSTSNVFSNEEEFPEFREFYYQIIDTTHSILLGKVDSKNFTGAVEYKLIPGFTSEMKVKASFFPRVLLASEEMGVVGFSSMFWKDQDSTITISNDEAHDSDLVIAGFDQNGDGIVDQIVEHRIINPDSTTHLITTNFDTLGNGEQVYFALENRDRNAMNYDTFPSAEYHLRSSYSIHILNSNVPLSLKIYESHTESEYEDNFAMEVVVQDLDLSPLDTIRVKHSTRAYNPKDTDNDSLTDELERLIGTCIDNEDTDGDGVSDYDELKDGTNPKTNIEVEASPTMVSIEPMTGITIQETITFTTLSNCTATLPILGIELMEDNMFSIVDTIGVLSECPYLIAEDGTFSVVVEFMASDSGKFSNTLIVILPDTTIQVPLMALTNLDKIENNKSVKVFPNPSKGNLTIYIEGWMGEIEMQIIDIQGRIIKQKTEFNARQQIFEFQINKIPKGSYFLELSNNKFHAIKKLIIQ